jgi:hypothetical protein
MENIGKLEKVDLRDLWKHEERDFSAWLAQEENLAMLSDVIGVDIALIERESHVGGYSVDLYAEVVGTEDKVIIENQLEDTNHDHLGKIITYASGKNAKYVIWIVKRARDEHRQAIEWLNAHTGDDVNFFLLEIELWRIGDSLPAPKFNVVALPNDWAREERRTTSEITERGKFCLEYWNAFNTYAGKNADFARQFKLRSPHAHNWHDLAIGKTGTCISMNIQSNKGTIDCGLYISNDKDYFERLKTHSEEVSEILGEEAEWREASKACRLLITKPIDITDSANWPKAFDWYIKMAPLFKKCAKLEN